MSNIKQDRMIIILVIAISVILTILTGLFSFLFSRTVGDDKKADDVTITTEEVSTDPLYTKEEAEKVLKERGVTVPIDMLSDYEIMTEMLGVEEARYQTNQFKMYSNDGKNKEYPVSKTAESLDMIKEYTKNDQYDKVIEHVDKIVENYALTSGDNLEITSMYNDAVWRSYMNIVTEDEKQNILSNFLNPYSFIVYSLYIDPVYKTGYYIDISSVCPYLEYQKVVTVDKEEVSSETDEYVAMMYETYSKEMIDTRNVYRYYIELDDGTVLDAYVRESYDKTYQILGMKEIGSERFLTVKDWRGY